MSTVAHPGHPMGPSIPADSSLTPLSWEGDKMFNIYIYDYCSKRGFKRTAKELLAEAEIPSESTPPINARQGLLFEWWSVFWVLFTAKANGHGPDDAMIYTQHQANQAANRQRQPPPQPGQPILQNGGQIPIGGQMRPPGLMNGLPVPGGPRNYIPNGVGPAPGFGNPQINGAPTPGPGPGYQNLMPGQRPPQRNGNIGPGPPFENHNPNSNSMPNSSQNPNNPNPNQPGPGPGPGQSPHMRAMGMGGMIPPGQNNQSGAGGYQQLGRPPSRTATPGAMMTQQSPRPTPMIDPQNLNAEITKIPQQVLGQLKQELGLESKDLPSLTMDDKQRILQTFRNRQQQRTKLPGQPNAAAGPSNMMAGQQQPQQRNTRPSKRNSTSPGDEDMNQGNGSSPPATKRIRRSPLEQPPMTPMAAGYPQMPPQQPMMGIPRGPPPNGFSIPQGMQMVNPMSVQMGNNMTMAGMSPGMSNNPGGMMTPQMQMQNLQNNPQHYRQAMVMHNNQRGPPMGPGPMNGQNGPMGSMASPPSDAQFNPGFNPGRQQPQQPGQKPMGMLPPPSPQGMSMSKDQQNQNQNNSNKEGNKEDGSATGTPTATGTAPPTPAPNMAQSPLGLGASGMNSAPSLGMGSGMGNAGSGMGAVSGMGNSGMGSDLFSHDFINSVADQLDFDPSMFKPDGDINFERDFGQWFSPDDVPAQ